MTFSELMACELDQEGYGLLALREEMTVWTVNGGYLAAFALKLAGQASAFDVPASLSIDFQRSAKPGPAEARVETIARGFGSELIRVEIRQQDKLRASATVWMVETREGPEHHQGQMPSVPHPDELRPLEEVRPRHLAPLPPFWSVFEQRPINRIESRQRARIDPRYYRWFRFVGEAPATERVASMIRTLPIIDVHGVMSAAQMYDRPFLNGLAPTVQMSVHFQQSDYRGDWLLCDALCEHAQGGLISSQVKIWGLRGELVANGLTQMLVRPGVAGAYVPASSPEAKATPETA